MTMNKYLTNNNERIDVDHNRLSIRNKAYSFFIASFISIGLIERIIVYYTNRSYVLFYIAIALFVCLLICGSKKIKVYIAQLLVLALFALIGIISIAINGASAIRYLEYFGCFYIPAILIFSDNEICYNQTLRYVNVINLGYLMFYVLFYHSYLNSSFNYASLQMEAGYNFVPCILFSITCLVYLKKKRLHTIISIFNIIVSAYYMFLDNASRGPIISILCFLLIIYIRRQDNIKKTVTVIVGFVIAVTIITNYEAILMWANDLLSALGINIPLLDKLVLWSRTNYTILNGRNMLYDRAFDLIEKSPIIGSGIGGFEKNYHNDNLSYVHQYFLQIACEFGVVGLVGSIIVLLNQLKIILSKKFASKNNISEVEIGFGIVFFCLSMPKLMFSTSYWLTGSFWLLLAWSLSKFSGKVRIKS